MARKQYIFGYGSLVSPDDIAISLGHSVEVLNPYTLENWIRDWSMVLDTDNTIRRFELVPNGDIPKYVAALNLREPGTNETPTNPNGVLFEVTDDDLKMLDARETHYIRVDVSNDISPAINDVVYTYVGKASYLNNDLPGVIVPGSYQTVVQNGFLKLGQDMFEKFTKTTLPTLLEVHPTRWIYTNKESPNKYPFDIVKI